MGVSILTGFVLHIVAQRSMHKHFLHTNASALVGKRGVIIDTVHPYTKGTVTIDGELWSARTDSDKEIATGAVVEVVAIKGSHLVIKQI